jgi:hypothetical protein
MQVGSFGPWLTEKPTLGVDGGGDGIGRPCERGDDAVAFSLLLWSDPPEGGHSV